MQVLHGHRLGDTDGRAPAARAEILRGAEEAGGAAAGGAEAGVDQHGAPAEEGAVTGRREGVKYDGHGWLGVGCPTAGLECMMGNERIISSLVFTAFAGLYLYGFEV
jgi:hypothetical protein